MRSGKAVNSSQAKMERTFHAHMLVESLCILCRHTLYSCSSALGLFLICFLVFCRISGSCSYKIVLVKKKSVVFDYYDKEQLKLHYKLHASTLAIRFFSQIWFLLLLALMFCGVIDI